MNFKNLTIRTKLILMLSLSAIIALAVLSITSAYYIVNNQREQSLHNLTQIAQITSENVQASLMFDDEESAAKILSPLKINPSIEEGILYTVDNKIFASYFNENLTISQKEKVLKTALKELSPDLRQSVNWNQICVVMPVKVNEEVIGYLKIDSDTKEIEKAIISQLIRLLLSGTAIILIIILISFKLHQTFTTPIYKLLGIMDAVSIHNKYDVEIEIDSHDEFKDLYAGFAYMLSTINNQNKKIELIHQQTRDSIEYSASIQKALLPKEHAMHDFFDDTFTIWQPKDTVGGDIYLFETLRHEDEALLMVIDCTGHGVPGAFVTMIVKAIEKEIVAKLIKSDFEINPAIIMQYFNKHMRLLLHQDEKESFSNAGFDGGIMYVNKRENIIRYAGSNTPLFLVQGDTQTIIKSDKESIGYKKSNPDYLFTMHEIKITTETKVYLTTDGYLDQTGGEKGFLFGKKRFAKLVNYAHNKECFEQKKIFENSFEAYRKNNEVKDDRTLIAFKINPLEGEEA